MTALIHRNAVRAILLTPEGEVLLMRIRLDGRAPFWIAPGGGIEPDEDSATALKRELREEVGLTDIEIGPRVWRRQHSFDLGARRYCQYEDYFIVHTPRFVPRMSDPVEAATVSEFRWWATAQLHEAEERLTPLALANIVEHYRRNGAPLVELAVEILED